LYLILGDLTSELGEMSRSIEYYIEGLKQNEKADKINYERLKNVAKRVADLYMLSNNKEKEE